MYNSRPASGLKYRGSREIRILTGADTCFVRAYLWFNCILMCITLPPPVSCLARNDRPVVNLSVGLYE